MNRSSLRKTVGIIGGGLAGLAAAEAFSRHSFGVEVFEARKTLGGRAGSFYDPLADDWIDHCQHVGMGCCTNLRDFFRQLDADDLLTRHRRLHFFGPNGLRYDLKASRLLPAPLHLGPSFLRLGYLTLKKRIGVARTLFRLAHTSPKTNGPNEPTIGQWLREQGQSKQAVERFWAVVLVSALGETLDRASLSAARKVFVDGFLTHRDAYQIDVPNVSLNELYSERFMDRLQRRGVKITLNQTVEKLLGGPRNAAALELTGGEKKQFDYYLAAVPWRRIGKIIPPGMAAAIKQFARLGQIESAPITAVHLWFDRPITPLPHAVLIDRLTQWVFNRGESKTVKDSTGQRQNAFLYQAVISASRSLAGREREEVCEEILSDLKANFPAAQAAKLHHWRMITSQQAVFSVRPGSDALRPPQETAIPNVMLAGDWTQTGWPATMEGAIRSGRLAAEAILKAEGRPANLITPDLPRGLLSRLLLPNA